jgi:hypothetical protein
MQPWIDKAGGSSSHNSTLHYDKNLSHINNYHHPQSSQQQSTNGFRTSSTSSSSRDMMNTSTTASNSQYTNGMPSLSKPFESYNFSPIYSSSDMMSLSDGSDVLSYLNSTNYSEDVHGDDLRPDSVSYISHRHQVDTQHALAEQEKLGQWTTDLMATDDIVEYLRNTNYTDDIYGIPVLGQWIKEAKEEVMEDKTSENSKKAIARLSMIRNHLVEQASGDFELAAQNAFRINENDWSSKFLDSP